MPMTTLSQPSFSSSSAKRIRMSLSAQLARRAADIEYASLSNLPMQTKATHLLLCSWFAESICCRRLCCLLSLREVPLCLLLLQQCKCTGLCSAHKYTHTCAKQQLHDQVAGARKHNAGASGHAPSSQTCHLPGHLQAPLLRHPLRPSSARVQGWLVKHPVAFAW